MENTIYDENNGLWYAKRGNYYLPYINLPVSGRLNEYLASIDEQTEDMFSRLVKKNADKQGVTEQLKEENQLEQVQRMNNIRACVKEVVESKLIYS